MYNLYLVQVVDSYGPNKFLPLAISYQWMYAQTDPKVKYNWNVADVLIEKLPIKEYVSQMTPPDAVAMSCYVWNWEYNRKLAQAIKHIFPNCKIIVGGPHIDKRDKDFFEKYPEFDIAVMGEGEKAFKEILSRWPYCDFDNISHVFPKDGKLCELPNRLDDVDIVPSPILEGFYDDIFRMYKNRVPKNAMWQVTYETMRGCPYHCAFCDIGDSYWNKARLFDIERVYREIDWMAERKIEYVSICDSNWGMFERDKEITAYVIKKKQETGYPKFWDVTWAKNNSERIFEIAMMDKLAGTKLFKGITFAMQSFNKPTLEASGRFNVKEKTANDYLQKYKAENIPTYSELIWPMPNETYNSLRDGIQRLVDLGQKDFLMVHPLVLTPNAPMGQPSYKKQFDLVAKTVPLDTFYLKIEDPDNYVLEYTDAVYSTSTADSYDVIKGNMFSYLFIVMYYYGWAHAIMEYMHNKHNIRHVDLIDSMLNYFRNTRTTIGREIDATEKSFVDVFLNGGYWGRQVLGKQDILWEYKGASSIVFHKNRTKIYDELAKFLNDIYNLDNKDLNDINSMLCHDYRRTYPIAMNFNSDTVKHALDINSDRIVFDHWDKTVHSAEKFYHIAYHYQRKNRYWRCVTQQD